MTDTERRQMVDEWTESDLSMAAFCRTRDIKYATFRLWIKKFNTRPETPDSNGLVKLTIPQSAITAPRDAALSLQCGPFSILVGKDTDVSLLFNILRILKDLDS